MGRSPVAVSAAIAGCLLATACAGSDGSRAATTPTPPPVSSPQGTDGPQHTGGRHQQLPDQLSFTAKTLDGKPFTGSNLAEKPVVFWFWAPWCPLCKQEAGNVAKVAKKYGDRISFVGVAGLDKLPAMKKFVSQTGTGGFPQLDDTSGALWKKFGVVSQSSYVFMTRAGKVERASGPLTEAELTKHITALGG